MLKPLRAPGEVTIDANVPAMPNSAAPTPPDNMVKAPPSETTAKMKAATRKCAAAPIATTQR